MNINHPNLKVTDELFKEFFNLIPNPIYIWKKVENDIILIDYNIAAGNITNLQIKEYVGVGAKEFHKNRPDIIEDLYRCMDDKLNFSKEMSYKYMSGKVRHLYVTYNHIPPGLILVHTEDITKRKKAEDYLKKSENEKTFILNGISELIVFQDTDNNIIRANKAAGDSVGQHPDQLVGQKCFGVWQNRNVTCEICPVNRTVKTGQIETDYVTSPDGKEWLISGYPVFDDSEKLLGVVEVTNDITAQKKAQEEIKESEEKYRSLFENMTSGFAYHKVLTDENNKPINYRYIEANPAFEKLTGLKADDIIGKTVTEILPGTENDPADWIEKFGRVGLTGIPLSVENYSEPLDRWYSVSGYSPKKGYFAVTFTDITERKKIEEKLKKSEEKYRSAYNRSNLYKDIFTHDINNILQNILSSLELSKIYSQSIDKNKEFEEATSLINEQVIRGKKLVKNVQNLSQVEEGKNEIRPTEALQFIKKTSEALKESFQDKIIKIEVNSSLDEYFVGVNKLLKNVFENILYNAVYHNKNNVINIVVNVSKLSKNNANYIRFEVLDNGVGIPDSMKGNIFSREYKEGEIPTGIGLGLLLVKRILEMYDGEISVEDRIIGDHSQGSKFIILIPESEPNN